MTAAVWTAAAMVLLAAGWTAAAAAREMRVHARLYGRPRGIRLRVPWRRRVPGLPCDGILTGEEEAVLAAIEAAGRRSRG